MLINHIKLGTVKGKRKKKDKGMHLTSLDLAMQELCGLDGPSEHLREDQEPLVNNFPS